MSSEKQKYARNERILSDKQQTSFSLDGSLKSKILVKAELTGIPMDKLVMCPFCLKMDKLQRFLVSGQSGISQSRAQCPLCNSGMMMKSVLKDFTAISYADWVFSYRGFFHKVVFETWKVDLAEKGWSEAFWLRYKALKADRQEYGTAGTENVDGEDAWDAYQQKEEGTA
jgi:hypothetical protein